MPDISSVGCKHWVKALGAARIDWRLSLKPQYTPEAWDLQVHMPWPRIAVPEILESLETLRTQGERGCACIRTWTRPCTSLRSCPRTNRSGVRAACRVGRRVLGVHV
jgi:hypothetical protein